MSFKIRLSTLLQKVKKSATFEPIALVCVSKYVSLEKMKEAYDAGVKDFAESRLQSALEKKKQMPDDVIWHFIGPIQSNKAKAIATSFDWVHSIASIKVAKIISDTSLNLNRKMPCFIEVNLSRQASKEGFLEEELDLIFPQLKELQGLDIKGFMTMGPHTQDEEKIRACFRVLRLLKEKFNLPFLSMGMSQDYEIALQEGATHIRIGSYLFSSKSNNV